MQERRTKISLFERLVRCNSTFLCKTLGRFHKFFCIVYKLRHQSFAFPSTKAKCALFASYPLMAVSMSFEEKPPPFSACNQNNSVKRPLSLGSLRKPRPR